MSTHVGLRWRWAMLAGGLSVLIQVQPGPVFGEDLKDSSATALPKEKDEAPPAIDLLTAARHGDLAVSAEGTGDGRMTLSVTNKTKHPLRVVLPPGLIASGATGQFGGMGGMGGGMGMGGMGGGMGGMGMGGMGGGMGGMGMGGMGGGMGGMGGRGGGMGMGGGTMPASMGMMMLGRLIMSLVGDRDSWDQQSLMSGMMGGMGGMGMGSMGGGMGGMGMGMGGMGGGMRSVPPTGLPFTTLNPKQTRHLPTRLVGLSDPEADQPVAMPAKGEKLRLGEINQVTEDAQLQKALKRLAEDKAPQTVAQLVMWKVAADRDWKQIEEISRPWANPYELTLAHTFVDRLATLTSEEAGVLQFEIQSKGASGDGIALALRTALQAKTVLGLKGQEGVPEKPKGPALACKIQVTGEEVKVQVATSDGPARAWSAAGSFTIPLAQARTTDRNAATAADGLAEGILSRMVRAQLSPAPRSKGKPGYKITITNRSPLVLNGVAMLGRESEADSKVLSGICIAPQRSMVLPASDEVVKQLGLKEGIRVMAADLSAL